MPDEQPNVPLPELPDDPTSLDTSPLDPDVPFHLPKSKDYAEDDIPTPPQVNPVTGKVWNPAHPLDAGNMPTIPAEPHDPNATLPGTGGLDPNPDLPPVRMPEARAGYTVPHVVTQQQSHVSPPEHQRFVLPAATIPVPPPVAAGRPAGQPLPRRKAPRRGCLGCSPTCLAIVVGFMAIFCGGSALLGLIVTATVGSRIESQLQTQVDAVDRYEQFQSTFIYDRMGRLLYESFGEGRRTAVKYSEFPQMLIDATVAIEDDSFFTNPGIDVAATFRAFAQFVGVAQGATGGSTITQQLVRNVLFDFEYRAERSIQRKLEEIGLALILNQRKSKEDILALYLNEIYYGNLSYGAEAAAQTFFGKSVGALTLGEAALLAGLPQAPAELDPLNPDPVVQAAVDARWRTVLDRMVTMGKITNEERNDALRQGVTFVSPDISLKAPHFTVYAQAQLQDLMAELGYSPEQIARGGLKVYTTLDLDVNDLAQAAARDQVSRLAANNVGNAAVVVLKPLTGEIVAMVGSVDYNNDSIDGRVNVTTAVRQPGSTMKAFTYSAAMETGQTPGDVIWDTPTTIGIPGQAGYTPKNYDGRFHGPMNMRTALSNSYNIPAVQTLRRYGVDYLLGLMRRFGVASLSMDSSQYGLSLTLGGGEMSLLELTNAYAVFANQGAYVPTTAILCVLKSDDTILYQYENGCSRGNLSDQSVVRGGYGTQALDPRIAFIIGDILSDNAARSEAMGGRSPLYTPNIDSAVKTGTTNDYKDNWTVGYTRNLAVGVWVGNSRGEAMINSSGLTGAAPIWNAVLTSIYANPGVMAQDFAINGQLMPDQMDPPAGVSLREMCDVRSLLDPAADCRRISEWMLDSPAAVPDAEGNLIYPPAPAPTVPAQSGPQLIQVSPGVYQVLAFRLAPEIASLIQFSVGVGQQPPPTPLYCQVPVELASMATGAQSLLFIAPPPVPEDAVAAEQYARGAGLAYLPTIACTPELLQSGGVPGYGPVVTTAVITSPQPGAVLSAETPIIGTVQFTPDLGKFYKVEIIGGGFAEWTTFGSTHDNTVLNGVLENLYVPGLAPGNYRIRLVIVDNTGGFLQAPYEVPFTVAG
jgi:penicillin-binding protein 1C